MKIRQIDKLIIVFLILALISLNYSSIDNFLEKTFFAKHDVFISRIIDGDTVESDIGHIRLLGINTPEKGEIYYNEAKDFLASRVFNKTVQLEFGKNRHDKYNRTLAYIFLDEKNINIELVEKGLANYYFYEGRDKYSDELENAWQICLNNNVNLCEKSDDSCTLCINIIDKGSLINNCSFSCDITNWTIKGEGRDKFIFNQTIAQNQQADFELDLTNSSKSIFLRDEKGNLVDWRAY